MTDTTILDTLNAYTGDNLWQDVIRGPFSALDLDLDDEAIEAADPAGRSDVFVLADGRTFRCVGGEWVAE